MDQFYLNNGAVHIVRVPRGKYAKVWCQTHEGSHVIESTNFEFCGMCSMFDKIITHGTLTIIRVPLGEFALCWLKNEPHFIDVAGLYAFDTPDFKFEKHVYAFDTPDFKFEK